MPKYTLTLASDNKFSSATRASGNDGDADTTFTSLGDLIQALSDDDDNGDEPTFELASDNPPEQLDGDNSLGEQASDAGKTETL